MARTTKKKPAMTPEEKLEQALVPEAEKVHTLPTNWQWAKLQSLSQIRTGKKDANYGTPDGQYLFFTCAAEPIRCDGYSFEGKAILLAGNGDISNISLYEGKFEAYQRTYVLNISPMLSTEYVFYYFKYRWVDYNVDKMFGTAIPYIRLGNLQGFPIPLPPLPEQHRIVTRIESLFAKLDEAREKAQAVVDGFEDRKAAILHKAFTGELIGLSNGSSVPLVTIVDTIRIGPFGSVLHKEDYVFDGVPVINPKHIVNQQIIPEAKVTITKEKADELGSYRLKTGDIVMGRRGEMGRSAPVTEKENGWLCGTGSLIIRLQKGYDAAFYSQIIASRTSVQFLEENCVGSTMSNLNEKIVKSLPVPDYSKEEQRLIVSILSSIFEKEERAKEAAEQVIDQIDTIKKSILARAFRGELGTNDPAEESAVKLLKRVF